jgi:predicted Zn-dependent peptidase
MNALEDDVRRFTDEMQITQGKLAVGFRLGACMEAPDAAAIRVFNAVFGGCATSKLFMNVRERLSLCYFASSMVDLHKGILAVSSGIDFDKYDAALAEIFAQLEAVKRGDFTAGELSAAKSAVAGDYRMIEDSPGALEDFYLNQTLIGPECPPAELAALAEEITAEEVVGIAEGIVCDAVYFLRGEKEGD